MAERKFGISFGLVNIPVKIHGVVKEAKEAFKMHMISPDGARVRQKLVCEKTGKEVNRAEVKKGYEYAKEQYVILDSKEVDNVKLKSAKAIEIVGFLPAKNPIGEKLDPIIQKEHFYITPEKGGEKGYSILYQVVKELDIMAVGRVVMSGREYTVTLTAWHNLLLLTVLYYPNEIVPPPAVGLVELTEREKELGKQLLTALGKPDVKKLNDRYIEALKELISAKLEGREVKPIEETAGTAESDIEKALAASLGTAKKKKLGVVVTVQGTEEMVEV